MKRILFLLMVCIPLRAQTSLAIGQLSCPASTIPQVAVAVPLGSIGSIPIIRLTCAVLDTATLVLNTAVNPPVLKAIGSPAITFVDSETPAGVIDGANNSYTLAFTPAAGSLHLMRNGTRQKAGLDYNLTGSSISFLPGATPQPGDVLLADYRRLPN